MAFDDLLGKVHLVLSFLDCCREVLVEWVDSSVVAAEFYSEVRRKFHVRYNHQGVMLDESHFRHDVHI